jgi:hypothetical protein
MKYIVELCDGIGCQNPIILERWIYKRKCNAMRKLNIEQNKLTYSSMTKFVKWGDGLEVVCEYKENK